MPLRQKGVRVLKSAVRIMAGGGISRLCFFVAAMMAEQVPYKSAIYVNSYCSANAATTRLR